MEAQSVTDRATETVITLLGPVVYGRQLPILIAVINADRASVILDVDGVSRWFYVSNPLTLSLEPGLHFISARFPGTIFAPPSESATLAFTMEKGIPLVKFTGPLVLGDKPSHQLAFTVEGFGAIAPTGSVERREGTTTIASGAVVNGSVILNLPLSVGTHKVIMVYSGDALYRSVAHDLTFDVLVHAAPAIAAHATADGIRITYALPADAVTSALRLLRRPAGTTSWAIVPGWNLETGLDTSVPLRGVLYEYQLWVTLKNTVRMLSNIDKQCSQSSGVALCPPDIRSLQALRQRVCGDVWYNSICVCREAMAGLLYGESDEPIRRRRCCSPLPERIGAGRNVSQCSVAGAPTIPA